MNRDTALPRTDAPAKGGLAICAPTISDASPRHLDRNVIVPSHTVGIGSNTTLKASFWNALVDEGPQAGDPAFLSLSLHTGGGQAWRNDEKHPITAGAIATLPFEGAHWRFEPPLSFVQFHLPFHLLEAVCEGLFDREIRHADLRMPASVRDAVLCGTVERIRHGLTAAEPTNLLLDSWALVLCEAVLRRLSSHGERRVVGRWGRMPERSVARVIAYIEAGIAMDLRLAALSEVAGMSVYHFARGFTKTVGLSPHAYVLSRRITRARALLHRTPDDLAQIALACGFSSQAHFTTAFRSRLGVTPGKYRHMVRS